MEPHASIRKHFVLVFLFFTSIKNMEVGTDFHANLWKFNGSWNLFLELSCLSVPCKTMEVTSCPTSTVSDFHGANMEVGIFKNRYGREMEDRFDFMEDRFDFMEDRFDFMEDRFEFMEVGRAFFMEI